MNKLPSKGDVIKCHYCKARLYEIQIDTCSGMQIQAKDFKPIRNIKQPMPGDSMVCPFCNNNLYKSKGFSIEHTT